MSSRVITCSHEAYDVASQVVAFIETMTAQVVEAEEIINDLSERLDTIRDDIPKLIEAGKAMESKGLPVDKYNKVVDSIIEETK